MAPKIYRKRLLRIDESLSVIYEEKDVMRMNMRLCVSDGNIHVSAPPLTPEHIVKEFVESNRKWVDKHISKLKLNELKRPQASQELFRNFHDYLRYCLSRRQEEMGLKVSAISVRNMASRWGSCNPTTRRLSFNSRLAFFPPECTDYVVVHELAHLVHPNHSIHFWSYVAQFCPTYNKWRKILRDI